ncbi:phenylalanine--tRNA ligase subunit alpha [Patescibacteria group bacterium]|nr:phenylalanine--tRNA ligase subunit alpha [Patescibacteria group bacterium]
MKNELIKIKENALKELSNIKNLDSFRNLEIKYLGRKGEISTILRGLSELNDEEKKTFGKEANIIKKKLTEDFNKKKESLSQSTNKYIDVTLPGTQIKKGHIHPITQIENELVEIFKSLGFSVLNGPELESDYYNFESLNIPKHHPARDMQDTFYVDIKNKENKYDLVMRTHTSPVQVRAMQQFGAPLKCVVPGRVFRSESTDAVHEHTFYQMEGLLIDKNINIPNMIAVMEELLRNIFKQEIETRIRPGYFPFVEPAIELDIRCTICKGAKCPACKHSGWLEILPAGMVHPNVLKHGGIDSNKYSGFAFGLGLTRLAMMKYGVDDIRLFQSGNLKFLEQF